MHKRVRIFFEDIKRKHPSYFDNTDVLDCGSLDINGNNRFLFGNCSYIGIDIVQGKNVDFVTKVHEFNPGKKYDVVISSEMLEHDSNYKPSIAKMFALTKHNGLLLITAAGTGRAEHGTSTHNPGDSPKTNDYYKNITVEMLLEALNLDEFSWFEISYMVDDISFAGIKR